MYKYFLAVLAAFIVSSAAWADGLTIAVKLAGNTDDNALYEHGSSVPLSYGDKQIKVNVTVGYSKEITPTVKVFCSSSTTAKQTKTQTTPDTDTTYNYTFADWLIPASDADAAFGVTGDLCRFEATATVDSNELTASFPFVLGCPEAPCLTVRGGAIKAGQPFSLDNLSYSNDDNANNELELAEIRLDSCTASNDPELFIYTAATTDIAAALQRAYPVAVGSTKTHDITKLRTEDGGSFGVINNLFFIGSGAGCNFTAYREAIIGGSNFASSCTLNLASTAAVSIKSGSKPKIMVKLGAKPTNANDSPEVYVSGNSGHTWKAWNNTSAAAWGDTAQDSGASSSADNTRNRALVKISDTCWQVINGS